MKRRQFKSSVRHHSLFFYFLSAALLGIFPARAQVAYSASKRTISLRQVPGKELEKKVTLLAKNEKLRVVLDKLEKQAGYIFVYSDDEINIEQKVSLDVKDKALSDVIKELFAPLSINFELVNDKIILKPAKATSPLTASGTGEKSNEDGVGTARNADIIINGRVSDEKGNGIGNVSIAIKGTAIGTTTNNQGFFTLLIPESRSTGVLVVSSVGYISQEILMGGKKEISVKLALESKELVDVVVVGYATQRKTSVTGAVDMISKKTFEDRPVANLLQALQGTSPNLIIQQRNFEPGQGVNLNIRGLGTLGNNTPLVVIDDIIGGDINLINPNDIETVSVLKDAGSAAIYGSRSANGVILITTKKGSKNQRTTIAYNGIYGIQSPRVTYEPVHAWENAYYKNESLANSGLQPVYTPAQITAFKTRGDGDWRLENILQNAPQQSHNITISGGGNTNTYLLSVGYMDQKNNFIGPDYGYKRYNLRLNQTTERGRFKLNTILSYVKTEGKDHSFNSSTLVVDAGRVPLFYSFRDSAGNYLTNPVSAEFNPKAILQKGGYRRNDDDEIFGNLSGEYTLTSDLKIRGVFGGTVRSNHGFGRRLQIDFIPGGQYGQDREVFDNNYKQLFTNLQLIAEYNKTFYKLHAIKILAGASNESSKLESNYLSKTLTDQGLGVPTSITVINPNSYNSNQGTTETSLNSMFGRVGYSYNDKYFAELNFRFDGSSVFPSNNRWGFFPSAAAAWRMTEEKFMEDIRNNIGDIKLRLSYGVLGNQNVQPYRYQTSFFNYQGAYAFNNTVVSGAGYSLGNPGITWEKAATFNLGGDFTILKRRLVVSLDYFDKITSDILFSRQDIPLIFGISPAGLPNYNVAKVRNRGWEIKATYNLPGRLFNQSFSINIADNLNELLALTSGAKELVQRVEEFEIVRRVGQPITVYQGYQTNGYFQNLDDINKYPKFAGSKVTPGDLKFVDRNGDGVIDEKDKSILGNPFPRYTFGFTYTLNVKGFDLSLFIQGVGKRDQMLRGELIEPFHFGYSGTMYTHQTDYWTPTNPKAKWPRLAEAGSTSNTNNYRTGSDLYLFNAAYARLKNLQIGYTLPKAIMDRVHLQKARIYFTGQNLVTLSKLNFLDPEITEFDNNTGFGVGANSGRAYPLPVFYGFGIDITF